LTQLKVYLCGPGSKLANVTVCCRH